MDKHFAKNWQKGQSTKNCGRCNLLRDKMTKSGKPKGHPDRTSQLGAPGARPPNFKILFLFLQVKKPDLISVQILDQLWKIGVLTLTCPQ